MLCCTTEGATGRAATASLLNRWIRKGSMCVESNDVTVIANDRAFGVGVYFVARNGKN